MRLLQPILVVTFASWFSIAAGAPKKESPLFSQAFAASPIPESAAIEEATHIQQECTRILALVPRLSPSENAWLQGELQANRDLHDLLHSPEWARRALYVHFYDCVVQSKLAATSPTERERVIAWARLASRFAATSPDDVNAWVTQAHVTELREPVKHFAAWEFLNRDHILDGIVIPYLLRVE